MRQCDNPSASSLLGPLAVPRLWRGLVLWLLLLLVLLPAASQSQSPPAPPRPKRSTPAWLALYKGEYKRAGELLAQAAAAEPANPEPRLGLARHREETGDYDGAEAALREALALAPAHREARARLAELLLYRGRAADALALAESFLKESAADPIGTALKGLVQIDRGEFAEAEKTLNAALDANYSGEVEDPDDLYFVALAAREYGNRTGDSGTLKLVAHELVPKIVEADKFYHRARVLEAGLYMEKDNAPDGAKTYNEILDLNPYHPLAHVGRAYVAIHDGKLDEAEREIARALQINPALPEAHEVMAQLHLWDQETAAALVDVEAMLKVDPTSMTALGLAAAAHYLRHDAERLAEVERRSLAAHPKGGAFYNTLGSAALQVMRFDVAETWFKKAIELDPQLWSAVLNRGTVLIHLGREEEGRKLVEEGFEQDSFNTRAFNLIKLFRKMDKNMVLADLERFHLRVNSAEDPILTPYLTDWLRRADEELSKKYGFRPEGPILVEDFAVHNDFSVRTAGIPGLGALGACFGKVVTLILPTDANFRMTGEFNWARVFWHEYAHVVTLQLSKNRVPRWFTEGLSVYEEKAANPTWAREMELELYHAWKKGELLGIAELNRGFTRPKYPGQVLLCYYHSSLICEFIAATWGFAAIPKMLRAYGEDAGTEAVIRQVCGVTVGEFDKQFDAWLGRFYSSIVLPPLCSEAEAKKLEERVAKDGKDAAARVGLAWWNFGAGKLDEARDHARQALAVDPKSADALAVLGYLADGKKDAAEARKLLEAAVAAGVKYHGVYLRLGRLLLEAKEPEKALAALEKAKAAFPTRVAGNENPYALLAKLHEEAGRRDRMIAELEALRAIDQDDYGLRRRLAEIYQKEKKPADVARVLAEANEVRALDPSLHEAWATALRELGRWEEAVREFETAIAAWRRDTRGAEADEKVGALYCDLAEVRLAQGKPEEAARALDDAEYAFPKSERVKPLRAKLPGAAAPAEKAAPKPAEKPADGAPEKPPPAPGPGGDAGAGSAPK